LCDHFVAVCFKNKLLEAFHKVGFFSRVYPFHMYVLNNQNNAPLPLGLITSH
jgi:hypothetical protein